jgi:hypothetical protein
MRSTRESAPPWQTLLATRPNGAVRPPPQLPPATRVAMASGDSENELRRAVEALAQALYEAEDPGAIAWAKRAQIVREAWLVRARRQLKTQS